MGVLQFSIVQLPLYNCLKFFFIVKKEERTEEIEMDKAPQRYDCELLGAQDACVAQPEQ
jgi:hypothetical protein